MMTAKGHEGNFWCDDLFWSLIAVVFAWLHLSKFLDLYYVKNGEFYYVSIQIKAEDMR